MKMSLSTSKLSYPEPMREFFSAFKTTNPGQPFCGPAPLSAASGYESLIKSESDSGPGWVRGGGAGLPLPAQGLLGRAAPLGFRPVSPDSACPRVISPHGARNARTGLGLVYRARPSTQMSSLRPQNSQVS